jgi:hypothetical protein
MGTVTRGSKQQEDDQWIKNWTFPEEDRRLFTSEPWRGEARWFRSPKVVCLATYRRRKRGVSK